MASVKKMVKKRRKAFEPDYKGMNKAEKKAAKKEFEESLAQYKKDAKKAKRKKRVKRLFLLNVLLCNAVLWRMFHSRASKKYKRRELGRR